MHSRVYITLKQNGTHNVLRPHVERHVGHDRARIGYWMHAVERDKSISAEFTIPCRHK